MVKKFNYISNLMYIRIYFVTSLIIDGLFDKKLFLSKIKL